MAGKEKKRWLNDWKRPKICIGIDQSYGRCGIGIAVDGQLKKVMSVKLQKAPCKTVKRRLIAAAVNKAIQASLKHAKSEEVIIICEKIRTFTNGTDLRPNYLKSTGALVAMIADVAYDYGIQLYSVDTRCWKAAILGTSVPSTIPIAGASDPKKFNSIRHIIKLGFEEEISIRGNNGAFRSLDDDACEGGCIALYGFVAKPKLDKED